MKTYKVVPGDIAIIELKPGEAHMLACMLTRSAYCETGKDLPSYQIDQNESKLAEYFDKLDRQLM